MLAVLTFAGTAYADPITVNLTIPNAHGTIGPSNRLFTAPSITFQATGDTSAVHQNGRGLSFDAPIIIVIPGVGSGIITDPSASVFVNPTDGFLELTWGGMFPEGASAQDPALQGYKLQTALGSAQVQMAQTENIFPVAGEIFFIADDGQSIGVTAGGSGGVLFISVGVPPQPTGTAIPALDREVLVLLLFLMLASGLWLARRDI